MCPDTVDSHRTSTEGETSDSMQVSVVIPAYNERGNLEDLLTEIADVFEADEMARYTPYEVVIVDDGSTDGTRQQLRDLIEEHSSLRVVFLTRNFGQSAALAAGIDNSLGKYIITMDADLQNDPADVPRLLAKLRKGYDCVSGWRRDRDDPLSKTIPSKIQTYLATLTGPNIHDFGCTLKAYRGDTLRSIDIYGEGHRYIPAKLHNKGYRITELEVNHRPREHGETKYGFQRLIRGFVDLLFHIFWNRYSTRPLHILGGLGVLMVCTGGLIGAHAVVSKYAFGTELLPRTPRLILTVALILFGFQMLMFGLLTETLVKLYYEDNDSKGYRVQQTISANESDRPVLTIGDSR
ncbi:glycosyltransferase family 2 protein [Halorussus halophilus]|uniref:glycosyltransferase family 2 protein n=1 Tax=Halorussus halophilus TaxID=2650975 RepID=UPI001301063C|nr:glycosyltransferase family 2 protein [Halorussus halophilus]